MSVPSTVLNAHFFFPQTHECEHEQREATTVQILLCLSHPNEVTPRVPKFPLSKVTGAPTDSILVRFGCLV